MKSSTDTLFPLLRLSLGTSPDLGDLSTLTRTDWEALVDLSFEQGVAALAVDGLQKAYEANPKLMLEIDKPELEDLRYEWFGGALSIEQNYSDIKSTAKQISAILKEKGVRALLVKGLVNAAYYPVPGHREFGDIDIYSPVSYQEVDAILKSVSRKHSDNYYRHSKCSINGISIENHRCLCDIRGQKRWWQLEEELASRAKDSLSKKNEDGLFFPDSGLSILFFLYHAQSHFIFESISLRFLTDWAVILLKEKELLSSAWFNASIEKYGLRKIAGVLTSLCVSYLGVSRSDLSDIQTKLADECSSSLCDRFLDDIFRKGNEGSCDTSFLSRAKMAFRILGSGWKFREFFGVGSLAFVLEKWCGILKEKVPKS